MDRLRKEGAALVYRCAKQHSELAAGGKVAELVFTSLELIERIAALVPPPRTHRHRYFGVLVATEARAGGVTRPARASIAPCDPVGGLLRCFFRRKVPNSPWLFSIVLFK